MIAEAKPRRSALYIPASKARALEKARTVSADVLIIDLEDAVAPSEKVAARAAMAAAVRDGGFGPREVVVRVNGLDTPWGAADIVAAAEAGPDAILLPKVDGPEVVADAAARMDYHNAPVDTAVWAMIETPRGVLNAAAVAAAPRLACLVMGTNDLVKDLRAHHTPNRAAVTPSLGLCVVAARAHGLAVLDGVYNAFRDLDGLRAECEAARVMGFDGKTLIHPLQTPVANAVFAPSAADIEEAMAVVEAYETAAAQGEGVAVLEGRIIENLHADAARRLLAEAAAIAKMEATARAA
ncbi:MAG: CoA ester lyase [Rhodobacteraceae bacterium]|nr:MAG: CoA ester lyase [Paracoccaceae bacterium]